MSHFAADIGASPDSLNSNLEHQSTPESHPEQHALSIQESQTVAKIVANVRSFAAASSAQPPSRQGAQTAPSLARSSTSRTVSPWPAETSLSGGASQLDQSEVSAGYASMPLQHGGEGFETSGRAMDGVQERSEAVSQEITDMASGPWCLRGTRSQTELKEKIENCVKDPSLTDPDFLARQLARTLLEFYKERAQSGKGCSYEPAEDDIEDIIQECLENHGQPSFAHGQNSTPTARRLFKRRCMHILEAVDKWFGSRGWAAPLERTALDDSAIDMSSEDLSFSRSLEARGMLPAKRLRDEAITTATPAKHARTGTTSHQAALQAHFASARQSQDLTQDHSSGSILSSSPPAKIRCGLPAKERGNMDMEQCTSEIQDCHGMKQHIRHSHYPAEIFVCGERECPRFASRKENLSTHFQKIHKRPMRGDFKIVAVNDIFCDRCSSCDLDEIFQTREALETHMLEHASGSLGMLTRNYTHRCTGNAKHSLKESSCIPAKCKKPKPQPKNTCRPHDFDSGVRDNDGNDDSDDEDHSGPPPPGGGSTDRPQKQFQSRQGNVNSSSNEQTQQYKTPYPPRNSAVSLRLARASSTSDLRSSACCAEISTINLIKKHLKPIRELGRGGFGSVDEVLCKSTNKTYARKIVHFKQSAEKSIAEVEILKQLHHDHIVNLDAYFTTSDQLWMFFTPVAAGTLATYLRGDARWSHREHLRAWEKDLASALKYLHERGVVHGDIKPQNVLVSSDMKIYLSDFGSARGKGVESSHGRDLRPASVLTPKYSAPEHYNSVGPRLGNGGNTSDQGAAADVFSLGCVLVEIETVYTGLSIHVFEAFRSEGVKNTSFEANLPRTLVWIQFLWLLQETTCNFSRGWTIHDILRTTKDMLHFDSQQRPNADQLPDKLHHTSNFNVSNPHAFKAVFGQTLSASISTLSGSKQCDNFGWNDANTFTFTFRSKSWGKESEGFLSDGSMDPSQNWKTHTPSKWFSTWKTSGTKSHFVGRPRCGPLLNARVSEGLSERGSRQQLLTATALHEIRSSFEPTLMKDLCQVQYFPPQINVLPSIQFAQSTKVEPSPKDLETNISLLHYTVKEYLRATSSPSSAHDALTFWRSSLGMIEGVGHQAEALLDEIPARHADIKPDNILVYVPNPDYPYEWSWKITDFGITSLQEVVEVSNKGEPRYSAPPEIPSRGDVFSATREYDVWSMGCLLLEFVTWFLDGHDLRNTAKRRSEPYAPSIATGCKAEYDKLGSNIKERAQNPKEALVKSLIGEPDSLTKSIAETIIVPMLELADRRPSWDWICGKFQTLLNNAQRALDDYTTTVKKAVTPFLSHVRSKTRSASLSSTRAVDGDPSDRADLGRVIPNAEEEPDDSGQDGAFDTPVDADLGLSPGDPCCSYCLERFLLDKTDSRYLFPARGSYASKRLDQIYLEDVMDRFERMFVDA